jgi:hypothetical protein
MLGLLVLAAGLAAEVVELDEDSYHVHTSRPDQYSVVMFYNTGAHASSREKRRSLKALFARVGDLMALQVASIAKNSLR